MTKTKQIERLTAALKRRTLQRDRLYRELRKLGARPLKPRA